MSLAPRGKRRTVIASVFAIFGMLTLVVYSPTLYRLFCAVTGYNGTTQRAEAAPRRAEKAERFVTVRFTAEVDPALPWRFAPVDREIRVRIGEQHLAYFVAENTTNAPITGRATFNVTPEKTGQYFNKIACFCFNEQTLQPHQRVEMPVSFFIDPAMIKDRDVDDVTTITLSYTFFRAVDDRQAPKPAAARN
ncbi:MAG: cytochrome c oxidase assembly protein [Rhodospirillaceae bacterium]|nr:cytochrome c oxidase assembly protein [Rhodospirillaceae bacterium]